MAVIMDGKGLAEKVRKGLKIECDELKKQGISLEKIANQTYNNATNIFEIN